MMKIDTEIDNIMIFTDENRLKQILLNLISHAFKFTFYGFIKLTVKYLSDLNAVEISVEDTGIGIKIEDHHLIFRENAQISLHKEYNSPGSGLGLSIVKSLADFLNLKPSFNSTYVKGSKFTIVINCLKLSITLICNTNVSYTKLTPPTNRQL